MEIPVSKQCKTWSLFKRNVKMMNGRVSSPDSVPPCAITFKFEQIDFIKIVHDRIVNKSDPDQTITWSEGAVWSVLHFSHALTLRCESQLQQTTVLNMFSLYFKENNTWYFMWITGRGFTWNTKPYCLQKIKIKQINVSSAAILLGFFRVNPFMSIILYIGHRQTV